MANKSIDHVLAFYIYYINKIKLISYFFKADTEHQPRNQNFLFQGTVL